MSLRSMFRQHGSLIPPGAPRNTHLNPKLKLTKTNQLVNNSPHKQNQTKSEKTHSECYLLHKHAILSITRTLTLTKTISKQNKAACIKTQRVCDLLTTKTIIIITNTITITKT